MFDVEILRLARQMGYPIKEVGVRWQDDGDSRSPLITGTVKHAGDLLRIRFMKYPPESEAAEQESEATTGVGAVR
jgi:hypothetical protein